MARTVSGPSQATVHFARKIPQELYYDVLLREKHSNF
jgi:hypothetical protein